MKYCLARLSPLFIGQIMDDASIEDTETYTLKVYEEYLERPWLRCDTIMMAPEAGFHTKPDVGKE